MRSLFTTTSVDSALLPMLSHIRHDGKLLTGRNPGSSEAIGQAQAAAVSTPADADA